MTRRRSSAPRGTLAAPLETLATRLGALAARLHTQRIRTALRLDCAPDAAWRAVHDPAVAAGLYAPVLRMVPAHGSLPEAFSSGSRVLVRIRLLGVVPLGRQLIAIEDSPAGGAATAPGIETGGAPAGGAAAPREREPIAEPIADPTTESQTKPPGAPRPAARTMRDIGHPVSGPLALLSGWHHAMTVRAADDGRTVWLDELTLSGAAAPLFTPLLWATWKWRGRRLRALARRWGAPPAEPHTRPPARTETRTR
ncbi:hypothetical protein [Leucobacter luti]|uniref:Polyketide cyclase/dehydrase/lipid transport protein n=1 Tax=Leucobacter luti TaxID=340320 RepID=A0A4Q7TG28_9MICO|nr:hypothetical protein [Leucobacter luti]MBL3699662.1 hypothetical protein [Leucobacter luti]RZT59436.1 hypothetical protein EV139_3108 [Leucobacter luti]